MAGETPSLGMGERAIAAVVAVMVLIVVGLGAFFASQGPPITSSVQSSSPGSAGCTFASGQVLAPSTVGASFTGCLTAGSSGSYLIAASDPDGMTLSATIASQYPIRVTVSGADVEGLSHPPGIAYSVNDTTSASPSGIVLLPQSGYSLTISNEGGRNNTITVNLQLNDTPGGRQ